MIWYNFHKNKFSNPQNEPSFYEEEDFRFAKYLLSNWENIKKELEEIIKKETFNPYFDKDKDENKGSWQTLTFKTWGIDVKERLETAPLLSKFISNYPEITTCSLNLLKGNSIVKAHQGDTNAILRCHIGIVVPASLPECGFEVNGEQRPWSENGLLIFCDALNHHAWNHSAKDRIVLVFDVIKEAYLNKKTKICITVRSNLLMMKLANKFPILFSTPLFLQSCIRKCISILLWLLLPIQKKRGVLTSH